MSVGALLVLSPRLLCQVHTPLHSHHTSLCTHSTQRGLHLCLHHQSTWAKSGAVWSEAFLSFCVLCEGVCVVVSTARASTRTTPTRNGTPNDAPGTHIKTHIHHYTIERGREESSFQRPKTTQEPLGKGRGRGTQIG